MLLRILVTGMSSASSVATGAAAGALPAAVAGAAAPGFALSTSSLRIRPPGPEPWSVARSMPFSAAIFLASGEALMRPPVAAAGAATAAGASTTGAAGAAAGASATGSGAAGASGAAAGAELVPAGASSPASPTAAIGSPTATSSPSPQYCLMSTPSSKHSTSIVALSVSTSAIMSPLATASPSFLSQRTSVPTVIVSLSLGISMSVAIS